jgi:hypothetical protein
MSNLYRKFDWPDFEEIQRDLVPLILEFVDQRETKYLFNDLTDEEIETIYKRVPRFLDTFESVIGQSIKDIKFIYIDESFPTEGVAHVDLTEQPWDTYYRINWPILNSTNHETVYFSSMSGPIWHEDLNDLKAWCYHERKLNRVESFVVDQPVMMDVLKIHGMYPVGNQFPRIILTIKPEQGEDPGLRNLLEG